MSVQLPPVPLLSGLRRFAWLMAVVSIVAAAGCSSNADDGASTVSVVERSMIGLRDSVSAVDERLSSSGVSEDLTMGWNDLKNDIQSVASDLVGDPNAVDLDGFRRRIRSFADRFQVEIGPAEAQWKRLIAAFDQLMHDVAASQRGVSNEVVEFGGGSFNLRGHRVTLSEFMQRAREENTR